MKNNVTTILMTYKDNQCQLLGYSKNCPEYFGYDPGEFELI